MKTRTLLIAAVMLVMLSAAAFGQSVFTTSSSPIATVTATGNAETVGTVVLSATSLPVAGDVYISYGALPITSLWASVVITAPNLTILPTVNVATSVYPGPGVLAIAIPAGEGFVGGATSYTISVSGVRVAIFGSGLTGALTATITTQTGAAPNSIAAGNGTVTVVNNAAGAGIAVGGVSSVPAAVAPVLGTGYATTATTGNPVLNSVTGGLVVNGVTTTPVAGVYTAYSTIVVKEGWLDAFGTANGVRITLAAAPPKGVTYSFPATADSYDTAGAPVDALWVSASCTTRVAGAFALVTSTSTGTALTPCYFLTGDTGAASVEYLQIPVTITSTVSSETFPLTSTTATYTVTMAVVAAALSGTPPVPGAALAPRFSALEVGPANLLSVAPGQTDLLMPYVSTQSGYNTGIAIANTTADPGTAVLGITGAALQTGPITFYFYPVGGTVISLASTSLTSPTSWGLNAAGSLAPGQTFVGMLNNLLIAAGQTTAAANAFSGYVIAVASFTDAAGIYCTSNWTNLTAYSAVMQAITVR